MILAQVCFFLRQKVAAREHELTGMSGVGIDYLSKSFDTSAHARAEGNINTNTT
jgi:hypothetical protein